MMLTLSGIQEYISQSKKTGDLKASSEIVVDMIKALKGFLDDYDKLKFSFHIYGECEAAVYYTDFLLAEVIYPGTKSAKDIEREISDVLMKRAADENAVVFPEEVSCYVAVSYEYGENASYGVAYGDVSDRMTALKNDRLNGIYFSKLFVKRESEMEICNACNRRPGMVWDNDDFLCEECSKKRKLQRAQKEYSFPSTWEIANIDMTNEKERNYYALIQMDVDDLGLYMSGAKGLVEGESLLEHQKKLVASVNAYREELSKLVKQIVGPKVMVYCGGDDVLFFCPVHKLWQTLSDIDQLFAQSLGMRNMTYSTSIVIAHCKHPLRHVVKTSRQKLHEVKAAYSRDDKGGLSFTFIYQGSGIRSIMVQNKEVCELARNLQEYFLHRKLSRSVIFVLEEDLTTFGQYFRHDQYQKLGKIIRAEIRRITARKIEDSKIEALERQDILENLTNLFQMFVQYRGTGYCIDMRSFFDLLYMLDKCAGICRMRKREDGKNVHH